MDFVVVSGGAGVVDDIEVLVAVVIATAGVGVEVEVGLWTRRLRRV